MLCSCVSYTYSMVTTEANILQNLNPVLIVCFTFIDFLRIWICSNMHMLSWLSLNSRIIGLTSYDTYIGLEVIKLIPEISLKSQDCHWSVNILCLFLTNQIPEFEHSYNNKTRYTIVLFIGLKRLLSQSELE
jgi:hypothetical protein